MFSCEEFVVVFQEHLSVCDGWPLPLCLNNILAGWEFRSRLPGVTVENSEVSRSFFFVWVIGLFCLDIWRMVSFESQKLRPRLGVGILY